jgi:CubicO group peptidase (beta-lactamase class C family)
MVRLCAAVLAALTCVGVPPAGAQNRAAFEAELNRLARQLGVPALSAAVVEGGAIVWVRHVGTNARRGDPVRYAIGGLTESFTAALAVRLVSQKKIALDAPVDLGGGRSATLQQVLSHTAAGTPGARFVHSARLFDRAGPALARAAGASSSSAALTAQVLRPLALSQTTAAGAVTASDGVESTVEDVAKLTIGLETGKLMPRTLASTMFQPGRGAGGRSHPYGLGWFVQPIAGQQIRWQAGSEAGGSSLVLSVPGRRLTLVILARGGRLNAPFWLSLGDVRWSPVATAFLSQWAGLKLELPEGRRVMTDALIALGSGRAAEAAKLAEKAASLAPGLLNAPDATLLAAFARSGQPPLHEMGETAGRRLLAVDPDHPRTLLDLAVLRIAAGKAEEGRALAQKVLSGGQATPEIADEAAKIAK